MVGMSKHNFDYGKIWEVQRLEEALAQKLQECKEIRMEIAKLKKEIGGDKVVSIGSH